MKSETIPNLQRLYCYNHNTVVFVAQGLLRDVERYYNERVVQGLPGPQGPQGPPGYSRLFGSSTNITDIMEFIKSKVVLNTVGYNVPPTEKGRQESVLRVVHMIADDMYVDSTRSHRGATWETRDERGRGIPRAQRRERYPREVKTYLEALNQIG